MAKAHRPPTFHSQGMHRLKIWFAGNRFGWRFGTPAAGPRNTGVLCGECVLSTAKVMPEEPSASALVAA